MHYTELHGGDYERQQDFQTMLLSFLSIIILLVFLIQILCSNGCYSDMLNATIMIFEAKTGILTKLNNAKYNLILTHLT